MVLKGVDCVNNAKIRPYGPEKSQLCTHWQKVGTQCKNQVIWSWKESIGVNNTKFRSYGLERDQLGTVCKTNNNI